MKKEIRNNLQLIVYILCGTLLVSGVFIGYKFNQISKKNTLENENLLQKINLLTKNYKRDSIELSKLNNASLAKIKQEIKDTAIANFVTYYSKKIIAKNEEKITPKKENEIVSKSSNVTTYTELPNYNKTKNFKSKFNNKGRFTSNVTTYTKLKNTKKKSQKKYSTNVTTYTKLPNYKTKNYTSKAYVKKPVVTPMITTYTKLNRQNTPNTKALGITTRKKSSQFVTNIRHVVKKSNTIHHGIPALDQAININTVEFVPVYPGCESNISETSKKKCLEAKIASYVYGKFDLSVVKNLGIKKGFNELRVLFIIDNYGKSKGIKVIGKWHSKIKQEAKRVINTLPTMTPGKKNGQFVSVKYSIKIPFIVK